MSQFTIVITTYNRLPLLRRAVESALAQTWPCEVVVADNGSDDGTEEYIRSLGSRVIYHRNSANLGHSGAVNAGVRVAKGKWIKPVDDDDYLAPNCIEEMGSAIAQRPQAVLCSCQAIQVDGNGAEVTRTQPCGTGKAFYVPQEDIHYGMLLEMVPFGTPIQVAFRKDAFLLSGGWDLALNVCDDIDSWIKIAKYGDAIFLNEYLAYRTLWTGGNNQKSSFQERLEVNMQMKENIYKLVAQKYRSSLPALEDINAFLKLHWSLVGLRQRQFLTAWQIAYPAVFSPGAWKLLFAAIYSRRIAGKTDSIRQEVLFPASSSMATEVLSVV
ncbi:glycosyltransferase family 2 protein [Microseira sp. BLCC-F43]|jgi:GT2 family glycosyltransferase|uniref:glycosyltransferase family 2 protein n=1 Tax=Microseira sp. BLCC-F43 TaxID=3153602 RepID=UPI0035B9A132